MRFALRLVMGAFGFGVTLFQFALRASLALICAIAASTVALSGDILGFVAMAAACPKFQLCDWARLRMSKVLLQSLITADRTTFWSPIVNNNECIRAFIHPQATAGITTCEKVPGYRVADGFLNGVAHGPGAELRVKPFPHQEW